IDLRPEVAMAPDAVAEPADQHDQEHQPGDPQIQQRTVLLPLAAGSRPNTATSVQDRQIRKSRPTIAGAAQLSTLASNETKSSAQVVTPPILTVPDSSCRQRAARFAALLWRDTGRSSI